MSVTRVIANIFQVVRLGFSPGEARTLINAGFTQEQCERHMQIRKFAAQRRNTRAYIVQLNTGYKGSCR